ncbi:hypothetical protein EI546_14375 [Aequorivita sp. H23M31]|uniref:RHS repeat protein n=1 Tax=Aequorivita ciconiae TaxID=2494375 RepID=A0A410G6C0_9FLAO|nr:hypothetical protein [Aequorivita sp. H23M31]QAA82829.1 hypothetical protein EI546_14375 [Aequorivita sp. H23M31]
MRITLILCFLLSYSFALAQYSVDWTVAPLNPIPEQYTLNHYKLNGKVESFTDVYGKTTTTFNRQGKAISRTGETDQTIWVYDSLGRLAQQKWGDSLLVMATYKTNEKGFITNIAFEGGRVLDIKYDKKGLFISKMEGDTTVVKYSYDAKNRVVQEEFFYHGVPNMLALYEYTDSPEGLTVKTTHINRNLGEMDVYTQKFNDRGDMVMRDNKKQNFKYDSHYNILSSTGRDFPVKYEYVYFDEVPNKKKK